MSTEERKPKVALPPQRGGEAKLCHRKGEKSHSPVPQSAWQNCLERPPAPRGGIGRRKRNEHERHIILRLNRAARLPRPWPGTERGVSARRKKRRKHSKPSPKLRKHVLGHNRAARVPRPAPALSGGGSAGQNRQEHPKLAQETQKTPEPINKKNPYLGTRKTENHRAQRRCVNQLSTAEPLDSLTLRWTPVQTR